MPSFVFSGDGRDERPTAARVLAFQLTSDFDVASGWSSLQTIGRIGNAIVDGATELQGRLQPDVHVIRIATPGVKATDFDRMTPARVDDLVQAGRNAAEAFIQSALLRATPAASTRQACDDDDDAFNALVAIATRAEGVTISMNGAAWLWRLFPTVLFWRSRGVPVRVALTPIAGADQRARDHEAQRRLLLEQLGAHVVVVNRLSFEGFILNGSNPDSAAAIVYLSRVNASLPRAMCYDGAEHYDVVRRLQEEADPWFKRGHSSTV